MSTAPVLFSTFVVTRAVFFRSRLSLGIVNLKPLQPGHVLILPRRVVSRIGDLTLDETSDLFLSVREVSKALEKAYQASGLTIGIQDGVDAGQSVPHVHVHIIPRQAGDYTVNDEIYPAMEDNEAHLKNDLQEQQRSSGKKLHVPKDEDRKPRSEEEMEQEAQWLASFFDHTSS